jgi:hypothetical protein
LAGELVLAVHFGEALIAVMIRERQPFVIELASPDHEGGIEKLARFQILQESRDRTIGLVAIFAWDPDQSRCALRPDRRQRWRPSISG